MNRSLRNSLTLLMLVATLGCRSQPGLAPSPGSGAYSAAASSARVMIGTLVETQHIPGFAVTVSVGPDIVWAEGFGEADVKEGVKATPDTKFRIGSVSKLLTAELLMRLTQEKRVSLDAPVGQFLALPPALSAVTLRQLGGHLGGVRHYGNNEFLTTTHYSSIRDALATFTSDSLLSAPGTRYFYSSYGFNLIGAALESNTQIPFAELVRRQVLEPLGMSATVPDVAGSAIPGRAHTYEVSAGLTDSPPDDLSGRLPSGGYLSSTNDLTRLGRSVLAPGVLDESSLNAMLTSQRLTSGAPTGVGIGWRIGTDSAGRRYFHHGGTSNGGRAFLLVYPDQRVVVAAASNALTQWGEKDVLAIAAAFLNAGLR